MSTTNNFDDEEMWEEVRAQRRRDSRKPFSEFTDDDFKAFYVSMDKIDAIALAKSPYCPVEGYGHLLDFPSDQVHEVLATVPGNPARFLSQQLMKSRNPEVWRAIAGNESADPTILASLTRSKDYVTCELAAWNPSTPSDAVDDYFYEKNCNKNWRR